MTYVITEACIDNARFFTDVLPGREAPLGTPLGSDRIAVVGQDTELVRSTGPRSE